MTIDQYKYRNQDPDDEYSTGDAMSYSVGSMGDEDTMGDGRLASREDEPPHGDDGIRAEDEDW
ncbi:hypothetical protein [Actinomadura litoris]|uniref:hypothetical protein n=1 Tax=Actinomadura litoris TaxID=2678616 RepID=UPI001FA6D85C|nr:hypothetical protein [Actinomadura litoris]